MVCFIQAKWCLKQHVIILILLLQQKEGVGLTVIKRAKAAGNHVRLLALVDVFSEECFYAIFEVGLGCKLGKETEPATDPKKVYQAGKILEIMKEVMMFLCWTSLKEEARVPQGFWKEEYREWNGAAKRAMNADIPAEEAFGTRKGRTAHFVSHAGLGI